MSCVSVNAGMSCFQCESIMFQCQGIMFRCDDIIILSSTSSFSQSSAPIRVQTYAVTSMISINSSWYLAPLVRVDVPPPETAAAWQHVESLHSPDRHWIEPSLSVVPDVVHVCEEHVGTALQHCDWVHPEAVQ